MQQPFLKAYEYAQTLQAPVTGLWLLHGDEPLLPQWFIQVLQPHWQGINIRRMDITSANVWQEILSELNSLSLFDEKTVVIAQGNHKPDKQNLTNLQSFAEHNHENCLIVICDKQDKKAQKTTFFQLFANHGQIIDCQIYQENQRYAVLQSKAMQFGINLEQEAWQQLMEQTEGNLLSAYQCLWRLSYLFNPSLHGVVMIDSIMLQDALVNQSHFSTFQLSDAMLLGDVAKVIDILNHLKQAEEPESLVLWVIAKDMRLLQSLASGESFASLGIWQTKQHLYQTALNRHWQNQQNFGEWTDLMYQCDKAIKGLIAQPAWELLYQSALAVAGVKLFSYQKTDNDMAII